MAKIKHEGLGKNRLADNPHEAAFAKVWREYAKSGTLAYLLYGPDTPNHKLTQRDAEIAATVMQWLGSPVGDGFMIEVATVIAKKNKSDLRRQKQAIA